MEEYRYIVEVSTYEQMRGDFAERTILGILGQRGYSTKLESCDGYWLHRSNRELDANTIRSLNFLPGVNVRKFSQAQFEPW